MANLALILLATLLVVVSGDEMPPLASEGIVLPKLNPDDVVQVKFAGHDHTEAQLLAIEQAKHKELVRQMRLPPSNAFGLPTPVLRDSDYGSDSGNIAQL